MRWRTSAFQGGEEMSRDDAEAISVAILARAPFPGSVKTRLAFMLGVDGAAELESRLIRRTVERALEADVGPVTLWITPGESHPLFAELAGDGAVYIEQQPEGDLGSAMHAAMLAVDGPALVLRTDCPVLTAQHLRDAADALRTESEAVIIPAEDGYILIGLRDPEPLVFTNMDWGSDRVLVETRRRLTQLGLSWREPAQLWEVERPTDVRRMRREGLNDLLEGIVHSPVSMFEIAMSNASPAA
jgi:rSAM/selenodomain-associated transferase 1